VYFEHLHRLSRLGELGIGSLGRKKCIIGISQKALPFRAPPRAESYRGSAQSRKPLPWRMAGPLEIPPPCRARQILVVLFATSYDMPSDSINEGSKYVVMTWPATFARPRLAVCVHQHLRLVPGQKPERHRRVNDTMSEGLADIPQLVTERHLTQ